MDNLSHFGSHLGYFDQHVKGDSHSAFTREAIPSFTVTYWDIRDIMPTR